MLVSVSTVRDSLPNLQRFVRQNLNGGIDHMFVFLDADGRADAQERAAQAFLDSCPHVTCVRTDEAWWGGQRPPRLNYRQSTNANALKAVLAATGWAEWVFHIDSDEVVRLDRAALAALPASVPAVRLSPLEAVSTAEPGEAVNHFKALLPREDLVLLQVLGVIEEPHNRSYFHGHVGGKAGMRPRLDLWLGLHQVVDADRDACAHHEAESLTLLHYESVTADEFVRKWTSILASGPRVKVRAARESRVVALETLAAKDLPGDVAAAYLRRLYARTTQDDFTTLRELGLLRVVDPEIARHTPRALPGGALERTEELLGRLAGEPKDIFRPGEVLRAQEALARAGRA